MIHRLSGMRRVIQEIVSGRAKVALIICENPKLREVTQKEFLMAWNEVPDWMKPEIMERRATRVIIGDGIRVSFLLKTANSRGMRPDIVVKCGPMEESDPHFPNAVHLWVRS